jgi:hypothetical protein
MPPRDFKKKEIVAEVGDGILVGWFVGRPEYEE